MNSKHLTHLTAAIKLLNEHANEDFVSKASAKLAADNLQACIDDDKTYSRSPLSEIVDLILNEVERASSKHPNWPDDLVYAATIVAEENGELTRACLQFMAEDGLIEEVKKEAIHTAATCIRLLYNIK